MLTALTIALLVASPDTAAPDTAAPVITHQPVESASRQQVLQLRATITDESGVFDAVLFWRPAGGAAFSGVSLERLPDGTFLGTLPVSVVQADAVEYFIQAYDEFGNGPANAGSAEAPIRVVLVDAPLPAQAPATTAPAAPVPVAPVPAQVEGSLPVGPFLVAGAGAAMTIVGAVMWFVAADSMGELNARYPPGVGLRPGDLAVARDARSNSRLASGLMMGGAAATAGGLAWWLLAPDSSGQGEITVGAGGRF